MALFNYATKEITLKVVYYGPGLSGKTTNLQRLHASLEPERRGKLLSLATEADRTLFFDFLPVQLGRIKDFTVRFQLYTVPGQVRYNSTRRLVLKGADAVVFVADSQVEMRQQNIESFQNMRENLQANNIDPDSIPLVLQYNKRDLPNILSIQELDRDLNQQGYQAIPAEAINDVGVQETFEAITRLLIKDFSRRYQVQLGAEKEEKEEPARALFEEPEFEPTALEVPPAEVVVEEGQLEEALTPAEAVEEAAETLEETAAGTATGEAPEEAAVELAQEAAEEAPGEAYEERVQVAQGAPGAEAPEALRDLRAEVSALRQSLSETGRVFQETATFVENTLTSLLAAAKDIARMQEEMLALMKEMRYGIEVKRQRQRRRKRRLWPF
jgi:hypothetical protein